MKVCLQLPWFFVGIAAIVRLSRKFSIGTLLEVLGCLIFMLWAIADSVFFDSRVGAFRNLAHSGETMHEFVSWYASLQAFVIAIALILFACGYVSNTIGYQRAENRVSSNDSVDIDSAEK